MGTKASQSRLGEHRRVAHSRPRSRRGERSSTPKMTLLPSPVGTSARWLRIFSVPLSSRRRQMTCTLLGCISFVVGTQAAVVLAHLLEEVDRPHAKIPASTPASASLAPAAGVPADPLDETVSLLTAPFVKLMRYCSGSSGRSSSSSSSRQSAAPCAAAGCTRPRRCVARPHVGVVAVCAVALVAVGVQPSHLLLRARRLADEVGHLDVREGGRRVDDLLPERGVALAQLLRELLHVLRAELGLDLVEHFA